MLTKRCFLVSLWVLASLCLTALALDENGDAIRAVELEDFAEFGVDEHEPRELSIVHPEERGLGSYRSSSSSSSKSSKSSKGSKGGYYYGYRSRSSSSSKSSKGSKGGYGYRSRASSSSSKSSKGGKGKGGKGYYYPAPSRRKRLGRCQGDCDEDSDCQAGLKCFHRGPYTPVPGCIGGDRDASRTDYCILRSPAPALHPRPTFPRPTHPRPTYPRPTHPRPSNKPHPRPTLRPNPRPIPMIEYVGDNGKPSHKFPLHVCQGDCDTDHECGPGLKCFQRNHFQSVPGCRGGENDSSRTDYCIVSGSGSHPNPPHPAPRPPTPRPHPRPTPRPHPRPTPRPPQGSLPHIQIVGNDGRPSSAYPLQACEGDCDKDDDCDVGNFCFQRSRNDEVPGCRGGRSDHTKTDYCAPLPPDQRPPPGTHRLKLYWQEGYYWQEETRERKWCMTFDYDGRDSAGRCWYGQDSRSCSRDQVHITKCKNDNKQRFLFQKLSGDEILIKLGNGKNECFERSRRNIYIRTCDPNNSYQRWFALSGSFNGPKFEISQKDFSNQCITTAHHPKAGEVVELHSCRASRSKNSETSYWNKY